MHPVNFLKPNLMQWKQKSLFSIPNHWFPRKGFWGWSIIICLFLGHETDTSHRPRRSGAMMNLQSAVTPQPAVSVCFTLWVSPSRWKALPFSIRCWGNEDGECEYTVLLVNAAFSKHFGLWSTCNQRDLFWTWHHTWETKLTVKLISH